jgi:hypothetical protein
MQDKGVRTTLRTAEGCCRQCGWQNDHLAGHFTRAGASATEDKVPGFGTSSGAWAWRLGADRGSETFDPSAVTLVIHSMKITHMIIRGDLNGTSFAGLGIGLADVALVALQAFLGQS